MLGPLLFSLILSQPAPTAAPPAHIQKYLDRCEAAKTAAIAAAEAQVKSLAADPDPTDEIRQKLDAARKELQRLKDSPAPRMRLPLPPQKDDVGTFEPADPRIRYNVDVLEVVDGDDAILRAWYLPPGETDPDEATFVDLWVHGIDTSRLKADAPANLPQVFHVTGNEVFDTTCGKRSVPRVEMVEAESYRKGTSLKQ
jgi:hypothetical protein